MLVRREQTLATQCGWCWRLVSLAALLTMVIGGAALMGVDRLQADESAPVANDDDASVAAAGLRGLPETADLPRDSEEEPLEIDIEEALLAEEVQDPQPVEEAIEARAAEQAIEAERAVEAQRAAQAERAAAERRVVDHHLQATRAQLAEMEKLLIKMKEQMAGVLEQDRSADTDGEKLLRELSRHSELLSQALKRIEGLEARLGSADGSRARALLGPIAPVTPPDDAPVLAQPVPRPDHPTNLPDQVVRPTPQPVRRANPQSLQDQPPPLPNVPRTPHPVGVPQSEAGSDEPRVHDAPGRGPQIDLIELAEAYNAALEQRELVNVELAAAGDLPEDARHTARRLAEVKLKSSERKLKVIRQIVETAIHAAESELAAQDERFKRVETLANRKLVTQAELNLSRNDLVQAETRLKILKAIVAE